MKIKEILTSDKSLLNYIIEVNGELYDESKHSNLVHIDTYIETYEDYNHFLKSSLWSTKVKFKAIEREKVLKLLKEKDTDNSSSDFFR